MNVFTPLGKIRLIERVIRAQGLTVIKKLLLVDLITYSDEKGHSWPSVGTLAAHAGDRERAIRYNLAALHSVGIIEREVRRGRNKSNIYTIRVDAITNLPEGNRQPTAGFGPVKPAIERPENRQPDDTKTGNQLPPNLISESVHRISGGATVQPGSNEEAPLPEQPAAASLTSEKAKDGELKLIRDALRELNFDKPPDAKLVRRLANDGHKLGANTREVAAFISTFSGRRGIGYGVVVKALKEDFPEWLTEHREAAWAAAEPERRWATAVPLKEAAANFDGETRGMVDDALLRRLRIEGITEISPANLQARITAWTKCSECSNAGLLASRAKRTLKFCTCTAGQDLAMEKGADFVTTEIDAAHADLKSLLVAGCEETSKPFLAIAIRECTVERADGEIRIDGDLGLFSVERDISPVLEYLGLDSEVLVICGERNYPDCAECENLGHIDEDGRRERCSCGWGRKLPEKVLVAFNKGGLSVSDGIGGIQ